MRRVFVPAALAIALLAPAVSASPAGASGGTPKEVAAINRAYHQGVADRDAGAIARLYAPNAKYIAPASDPISGRTAIRKHLKTLFTEGLCGFRVDQTSLTVDGRLAVGYGTYATRLCQQGASQTLRGSYVLVYQRQPGGALKILYDIFNAVP